jgi:hypothetical protein
MSPVRIVPCQLGIKTYFLYPTNEKKVTAIKLCSFIAKANTKLNLMACEFMESTHKPKLPWTRQFLLNLMSELCSRKILLSYLMRPNNEN